MDLTEEAQRIIDGYLDSVRETLQDWSEQDREEICANLRDHILAELAGQPATEGEVADVLAALGPPEQVAEHRPEAARRRLNDLLLHPFSLGVAAGLVLFATVAFTNLIAGILLGLICLLQIAAGLCGRRFVLRRGGSVPAAAMPVVAAIGAVLGMHVVGSTILACLMSEMIFAGRATFRHYYVTVIPGFTALACFALLSAWCALGGKLPGRRAEA